MWWSWAGSFLVHMSGISAGRMQTGHLSLCYHFLIVNLGLLIAWQTQVSQTYPSLLKAPGVGIPRGLGGSCKPA